MTPVTQFHSIDRCTLANGPGRLAGYCLPYFLGNHINNLASRLSSELSGLTPSVPLLRTFKSMAAKTLSRTPESR